LVQKHVTSSPIAAVTDFIAINAQTIDLIKQKHGGDDTKVINLIKSIEKTAEEESGDPFLIAMAERAKQVQENYEDRQTTTLEAKCLFAIIQSFYARLGSSNRRSRPQASSSASCSISRVGQRSSRSFAFLRERRTIICPAGRSAGDVEKVPNCTRKSFTARCRKRCTSSMPSDRGHQRSKCDAEQ
jgi:hypothetical protein